MNRLYRLHPGLLREERGVSEGTYRSVDGRKRRFGPASCDYDWYTVVGVAEVGFEPRGVSWISPLGKALLAAELGDRVTLEDGCTAKIVKIE